MHTSSHMHEFGSIVLGTKFFYLPLLLLLLLSPSYFSPVISLLHCFFFSPSLTHIFSYTRDTFYSLFFLFTFILSRAGLGDDFDENERRLRAYLKLVDDMNTQMRQHLQVIEGKAEFHRMCLP